MVADYLCVFLAELVYGFGVEMVAVFVSDENDVGAWHGAVVGCGWYVVGNGVDVDPLFVDVHLDAAVFDAIDVDGSAVLCGEQVDFFFGYGFAGIGPCCISGVKFDDIVAVVGEYLCSFLAAFAAAAVDGYGLVLWECRCGYVGEVVFEYVDVDGPLDVAVGVFVGCAYIESDDGRVGYGLFVFVDGEASI